MAITRTFTDDEDYIGLEEEGKLVCMPDSLNLGANVVEKVGANGAFVASKEFGKTCNPSCSYDIVATIANFKKRLGHVYNNGTAQGTNLPGPIALQSFTVSTSAGGKPTLTATGALIEAGGTGTKCEFETSEIDLSPEYHATDFGVTNFEDSATAWLSAGTYTAECTIAVTAPDGTQRASDAHSAKETVTLTITTTGTDKPAVAAQTGWTIASPLTRSRSDGDFPTWTCTLTKFLAVAAAETPAAQTQGS